MLHSRLDGNNLHVAKTSTGLVSPVGTQLPTVVGQIYTDTVLGTMWIATGLTNVDWKSINVGSLTFSSPLELAGGDVSIPAADASHDGYLTSSGYRVLAAQSGTNTGDETQTTIQNKLGIAAANASGYLTSAGWATLLDSGITVGDITTSTGLSITGGTGAIIGSGVVVSGVNAAADGSTKGIAAFATNDFNSSNGIISLDYANGQKASTSVPGFFTSAGFTTLAAQSGSNTGDETTATIKTKLGTASAVAEGYLTSAGWATLAASGLTLGNLTTSTGLIVTGGTGAIIGSGVVLSGVNAAADGSTKGIAAFATNDFNSSNGVISIDYANGQAASATVKGYMTSAGFTTLAAQSGSNTGDETTATIKTKLGIASAVAEGYLTSAGWATLAAGVTVGDITTSTGLSITGGTGAIIGSGVVLSGVNAAADGSTKGIAAFATNDFNASNGVISIDYVNGQAASTTVKGYMTSAGFTTLAAQSGSNTGDETTATIKTKLGTASSVAEGYLTSAGFVTFNNKQNALTLGNLTASLPISQTGGTGSIIGAGVALTIADAQANGSTKGAATFTANDFNDSSGLISIDYANGQAASTTQKGFLTSAGFVTFNNKQNALSLGNLTASLPISQTGGTGAIVGTGVALTIADAQANGSTKGAATFTANDFNDSSGLISIDYANGQAASTTQKGFLTSAGFVTFNNKQGALVNSAGLAAALSDETGTGLAVFSTNPVLVTPNIGDATTDKLHFNLTPVVGTYAEGKVFYDETWKTLSAEIGRDVTLQIGQEDLRRVYNDTAQTILNGRAVYTTGVHAEWPKDVSTVDLARADSDVTAFVLGVATQDIPANNYGFITVRGHINGLDTSTGLSWTAGDILYLSATSSGILTNVIPEAPNLEIRVGRLITKHATNGRINIRIIQAYRLGDLADVTTTTPAVDEILKYNGSEWVNGAAVTSSASKGIELFLDGTVILSGTIGTVLVMNPTPAAEGTGYSVDDVLTVVQAGASGCTLKVLTVDAGKVKTFELLTGGALYTAAAGRATTSVPSAGRSGCTVTITTVNTNNVNNVETMSKTPWNHAEDIEITPVNNNTVLSDIYLYNTAVGRTSLSAGVWAFHSYAGVSRNQGVSEILGNLMRVREYAGTVTITNSDATHKIVTASEGTPFLAANLDVGGTLDSDSFLQTPTGVYRITTRTDNTHLIILVPTTYVNETAVSFSVHKRLFQITTGEINNLAGAAPYTLQLYSTESVQPEYTILTTDKLAAYRFSKNPTDNANIYFAYGGTTRYSRIETPLVTLHGNLAGLQGGSGSVPNEQYFHLTTEQHTISTQAASSTLSGYLTSAGFVSFTAKQAALTIGNLTASLPISQTGGTGSIIGTGVALTIADAQANGSTKGAATFTANDFNDSSGVISIDYANGQAASTTVKGFLTSAGFVTFNNKQNALSLGNLTASLPISQTGGTGAIVGAGVALTIADAAADGSTKGAATFTATDFNASSGVISIDYANGQAASTTVKGFLTSAGFVTFNNKQNALSLGNLTATLPISQTGGTGSIIGTGVALTIADAQANGSTKGAATFTANDFNDSSGVISIDYANGQAASTTAKGFLTSAGYVTFNNKQAALTLGNLTASLPISQTGGTGAIVGAGVALTIADAQANGSTKGAATFTATDFNDSSGVISIDYANGQAASTTAKGFLTSAGFVTFNNKQNALSLGNLTASLPISQTGGTGAIVGTGVALTISDAVADGSTKGAATFTANDFNASSGVISIDYANGQAASTTVKGFLTSAGYCLVKTKDVIIQCLPIATGWSVTSTGAFFTIPLALNGMRLTAVSARCITAGASGSANLVQFYKNSAVMLSTLLMINAGAVSSSTAATPYVFQSVSATVSTGDLIVIGITQINTTAPKGMSVDMTFAP